MGNDELRTWLTYAEAGQALGMQPSSVKRLSFRRKWPRRTGNDGLARVGVPVAELHPATGDATGGSMGGVTGDETGVVTGGNTRGATGGSVGTSEDAASIPAETLAAELAHVRVQLAAREGELAGMREALRVAEMGMHEVTRRAEHAEQAAVDAWRTTADLVRLLAQAKATDVPSRVPPRRQGWLRRLLKL